MLEDILLPQLQDELKRELMQSSREAVLEEARVSYQNMISVGAVYSVSIGHAVLRTHLNHIIGPYMAPIDAHDEVASFRDMMLHRLYSCPNPPFRYSVAAFYTAAGMPFCLGRCYLSHSNLVIMRHLALGHTSVSLFFYSSYITCIIIGSQ
jgi:hypothetical protein